MLNKLLGRLLTGQKDKMTAAGLFTRPSYRKTPLPEGAEEYLKSTNPRLHELKERYRVGRHPDLAPSALWSEKVTGSKGQLNLKYFRGDNIYVWQYRSMGKGNLKEAEIRYLLTALYVKGIDTMGLMERLGEDGLFGVHTFDFGEGKKISRDLLDSIVEIYFLEEAMGLSKMADCKVIDIGAGYGRFAHRLIRAMPNVRRVFCVDAIAESTFLSEYYLRFRGVDRTAVTIPLDELDKALGKEHIDLATNIHSFPECTLDAVNWWLDFVRGKKIPYLFIAPNGPEGRFYTTEKNGSQREFLEAVESRGYRLRLKRPKYELAEIQKYGIHPAQYYFFELK